MKSALTLLAGLFFSLFARAQVCVDVPDAADLKKALIAAREENNGGLNQDMWAVAVDRSGVIRAVVYTGANFESQWPGSRLIAAQKAYTANAFSLSAMALSTANLYAATQPGGFLYGLSDSNPVNAVVAYRGAAKDFGTVKDPLVGERLGGINTFGGGLALYNNKGLLVGALGVSGDTSCADHNIAWRTRHNLHLDYVPSGNTPKKDDNIIYDLSLTGKSKSGFGHPKCIDKEEQIAKKLPAVRRAK